ncbi:sigma-70 family RNA polymerase sigma factor [Microvirga sp. BT689]|uniref:sigma-70 family RNA polymerase sigma factor n=1 Tax=Microvirga arvi TaxID=2778731 RepID=UPI00194DC2A1|nr:sigma-70 family RNA polymerase sigma factor [Microvirga arvi]MBM6583463.1 sigma-70 family RNA polymerase sigma factor [Microvirga arvi]
MTQAARQHSHPIRTEIGRSRSARRKLARLRHIHPLSHTQHLALVEEVRVSRCSQQVRHQLPAFLPHLRNFALSLTHDPVRSDDLVQSTVLRAWANLDRFQHGTNLEAWLFTIMRNSFYSEYRQRRWEVEDPEGSYASTLMTQPVQEFGLMLQDLQQALVRLPPDQREALLLVAERGGSYDHVAALCGVAVGTIKSRVNRARNQLSEMLQMENRHDLGLDCLMQAALQQRNTAAFDAQPSLASRRMEGHMPSSKSEKPQDQAKAAERAPQEQTSAFLKPLQPSPELSAIVGTAPLPRPEVVSKVWEYIKKHKLQNPQNKREIMADEKLQAVFGGKNKVSMFEMNKHLAQHLK